MAREYNALREASGNWLNCSLSSVDETVGDCVCTSSVPPLTSTVSVNAPISSLAVIAAGVEEIRRTSLATYVLKPASDTVTV